MKRITRWLLGLMIVLVMSIPAMTARAETTIVAYVGANGATGAVECTVVGETSSLIGGNDSPTGGWYAVTEDVTFSGSVMINYDVNLILCDGATLTANDGIWVKTNSRLTIWAQSTGDGMGKIVSTGSRGKAGIGGVKDNNNGTVVINGGHIEATGGNYAAGIGGGEYSNGGAITINGGDITAVGNLGGAGIGGGQKGSSGVIVINGGNVDTKSIAGNPPGIGSYAAAGIGPGDDAHYINLTINGGHVTADSTHGAAAGIGSARSEDINGTVTVNGGYVKAIGRWGYEYNEYRYGCAAIGAGYYGNASGLTVNITGGDLYLSTKGGAAGIGGGAESDMWYGGEGANVSITGGTVIIDTDNCAIGHGGTDHVMGTLTLGDNMKVYAGYNGTVYERNGWPFTAAERVDACHYRSCVRIEPCLHPGKTYESLDEYTHVQYCEYCYAAFEAENHTFDPETQTCTVCGYKTDNIIVTFDPNGGTGESYTVQRAPSTRYYLPLNSFTAPSGKMFTGWQLPDGEIKREEESIVTGTESMTIKATWADSATIYFRANNGKIQTAYGQEDNRITVNVPKGEPYTIPDYQVTWEGSGKALSFLGWRMRGGTDTTRLWMPGEKFTPEADYIVLEAAWGVYVTFDNDDGNKPNTIDVLDGEQVPRPEDPTRNGYVFQGWYQVTDADAGTLAESAFDFDTVPTADITLKAVWLTPWQDLQAKIDNAENGETIALINDVIAEADDAAITVPEGKAITIDLNGFKIDRARTAKETNGYVIRVEGGLTVKDSSEDQTGAITGGWTSGFGGGVYVAANGRFTLSGGKISGNTAKYGGGVCVDGAFAMTGGEISGNMADYYGGGVYVNESDLDLSGGTITGNTAEYGGGVYLYNATFELSGGPIVTGNEADGKTSNVELEEDMFITVVGDLTDAALIGVSQEVNVAFTSGLSGHGTAANFTSDNTDYVVGIDDDGEARLAEFWTVTFDSDGGNAVEAQRVAKGAKATKPEAPAKSGYAFRGWQLDGEDYDFDTAVTEDITLTATWEMIAFGTPDFTLPGDVTAIEESAFQGIAASVVYIPDGCGTIGAYAFKDCPNLTQIRIPAGCAIGENAFDGCERVWIFGTAGSAAEQYCENHDNCVFVAEGE